MDLQNLPESSLTPEQENLASTRRTESDLEDLVMHSMREAFLYAHRCSRGNLENGEIISACYLALRDAVKNFRPNRIRFFAYAKPYIRGKVISEFRGKDVVRKARNHESLDVMDGNENTKASIECFDGQELLGYDSSSPLEASYQEPDIDHAKEELASLSPILLHALTDKERMIIDLRYRGGLNFRQIGDMLSVSRSNTQNEHQKALKKVRQELMNQKRLFNR